jgi:hypothetical protein
VGGNDTFVFADTFGRTRIYDFEKGKDHLEIDISWHRTPVRSPGRRSARMWWSRSMARKAKGEIVLVGFSKSLGTGDFYFV